MNQLASRLLLGGAIILLGGCSDDDGIDVKPKDPTAQAGSGGAAGQGGSSGAGGSAGNGGSSGNGGSGEPPDAGMDTCTPVFLDGGVVATDAGADAGDAGDAGPVIRNGPVTFAADIHPIFRANCVPCHEDEYSGGHNVAAVDVAEAYGFVSGISERLLDRVNGGGMPPTCSGVPGDPGCLSVAEFQLIQRWAAQCFPP